MIPNLEELTDGLTPEQQKQLKEDMPYLEQFMEKCNVSLIGIRETSENFPSPERESMYIFDDNLEEYTIEGVKGSLEE